MNVRSETRLCLVAACACLAAGAACGANPEDVSFRHRGDNEKNFVRAVGTAIIKAAHTTAKKIDLIDYKYSEPKPGRKDLRIDMDYHGVATNKRYVANIVVKLDVTNKDAWEVLNIEYSDNNVGIKHNERKVQELIKRLNR
jgi:hypothetical protein